MKNCLGRNREIFPTLSAPVRIWFARWIRYFLSLSTMRTTRLSIPAHFLKPLDTGIIIWKPTQKLRNADGLGNVFFHLEHNHLCLFADYYILNFNKGSQYLCRFCYTNPFIFSISENRVMFSWKILVWPTRGIRVKPNNFIPEFILKCSSFMPRKNSI